MATSWRGHAEYEEGEEDIKHVSRECNMTKAGRDRLADNAQNSKRESKKRKGGEEVQ